MKEVLIGEKVLRRLGNPCEKPKGLEPEDGLPFEKLWVFFSAVWGALYVTCVTDFDVLFGKTKGGEMKGNLHGKS